MIAHSNGPARNVRAAAEAPHPCSSAHQAAEGLAAAVGAPVQSQQSDAAPQGAWRVPQGELGAAPRVLRGLCTRRGSRCTARGRRAQCSAGSSATGRKKADRPSHNIFGFCFPWKRASSGSAERPARCQPRWARRRVRPRSPRVVSSGACSATVARGGREDDWGDGDARTLRGSSWCARRAQGGAVAARSPHNGGPNCHSPPRSPPSVRPHCYRRRCGRRQRRRVGRVW